MTQRTIAIEKVLRRFPSVELTIHPTPIHKLSRLSSRLNRNIYIMREDLTGFAIGGNKVRKLDYLVGDARLKGADALVTRDASNFSRNAGAASKAFGFEAHVVLAGYEADQNPTSQILFHQFDTKLHYAGSTSPDAMDTLYRHVIKNLKARRKMVYELHPGGSDCVGAMGYLKAFEQIVSHSENTGIHFNRIMHATGSTATQTGLLMGQCISGYETSIVGIAISQKSDVQRKRVRDLAVATAENIGVEFDTANIVIDDRFLGAGYAIPSTEGSEAIKLLARLEGVLLDEHYTGKAAAGLIAYAEQGIFDIDENILFVHTGGNSGIFY